MIYPRVQECLLPTAGDWIRVCSTQHGLMRFHNHVLGFIYNLTAIGAAFIRWHRRYNNSTPDAGQISGPFQRKVFNKHSPAI